MIPSRLMLVSWGNSPWAAAFAGPPLASIFSDEASAVLGMVDPITTTGESQSSAATATAESTTAASEDHLARGLENEDGANHCFLNVVIQAFWSLRSFRTRFLAAAEHAHSWEPQVCSPCLDVSASTSGGAAKAQVAPPELATAFPFGGCSVVDEGVSLPAAIPALAPRSLERTPHGFRGGAADDTCCYCALKSLFTHYRYSELETLPPDSLRKSLSHIYTAQGRFQLGEMEDATETIEVLLDVLHASSVSAFEAEALEASASSAAFPERSAGASSSSDPAPPGLASPTMSAGKRKSDAELVDEASNFPCQPLCIAHEVFGIEYVDIPRCTFCGSNGEPSVTGSFLLSVYVADLLALDPREEAVQSSGSPSWDVSTLWSGSRWWGGSRPDLHSLLWRIHHRSTPNRRCGECSSLRTMVSERWLTRRPCSLLLSLVWPDSKPSRENLWWVLSAIQPVLSTDRIFQHHARDRASAHADKGMAASGALPPQPAPRDRDPLNSNEDFVFCGMICYCGLHYIAIFWCWVRMQWMLFDDTTVRQERDWSSVVSLILCGSYVPTLLFHERCSGHGESSHELPRSKSLEVLRSQIEELEDRPLASCSTM